MPYSAEFFSLDPELTNSPIDSDLSSLVFAIDEDQASDEWAQYLALSPASNIEDMVVAAAPHVANTPHADAALPSGGWAERKLKKILFRMQLRRERKEAEKRERALAKEGHVKRGVFARLKGVFMRK